MIFDDIDLSNLSSGGLGSFSFLQHEKTNDMACIQRTQISLGSSSI